MGTEDGFLNVCNPECVQVFALETGQGNYTNISTSVARGRQLARLLASISGLTIFKVIPADYSLISSSTN